MSDDIARFSFREYTPEEKMIAALARKEALEECAQLVERLDGAETEQLAAAIRASKDKRP